jgi:hypothetical protein
VLGSEVAEDPIKPNREGEPEAGMGTEGGRFARSTEESGPMKPGNRAEDKTLRTRKEEKKEDRSSTENPPLATVNTHLIPDRSRSLGSPIVVIGMWEVADERRAWQRKGVDTVL